MVDVGRRGRTVSGTLAVPWPAFALAPEVTLLVVAAALAAVAWAVLMTVVLRRRRQESSAELERSRAAQQRAEHEAAHQRQLNRQTFAESPLATAALNRDLRFIAVNRLWCRTFGLGREETVGRSWDQVAPQLAAELSAAVDEAEVSRVAVQREIALPDASVAEVLVSPVEHPEGGCHAVLLVVQPSQMPPDASTTLAAEVVPWSIIPGWLVRLSADGVVQEVTGGLAEALGWPRHDLIGRSLLELVDDNSGQLTVWLDRVVDGGGLMSRRARFGGDLPGSRSGEPVLLTAVAEPVEGSDELPSIWVSMADLGGEAAAEEMVRLADERFLAALTAVECPVVLVGPGGQVAFWSDAAEAALGCSAGEVIGRPLLDLLEGDGAQAAARLLAEGEDGQAVGVAGGRLATPDGPADVTMRCVCFGDRESRFYLLVIEPQRETDEPPSQPAAAVVESLLEAVRGSLNAVLSRADLVLDGELDREQRVHAEAVRSAAQDVVQTALDVGELCRLEDGSLVLESLEFDVRSAVTRALEPLAVDSQREIVSLLHPEIPERLEGDPGRLRFIVRSLVALALHLSDGESVSITFRPGTGDQASIRVEVLVAGGVAPYRLDGLRRAVSRIDSTTVHMFAPEMRSVAIARRLIDTMGGRLYIESSGGRGTAFWFELALSVVAATTDQVGELSSQVRSSRVLVVDDCEASRAVFCTYLQAWGARYGAVAGGEQALQLLRHAVEESDPFDLALVDRDMPGLDGETLGKLVSEDPQLRSTRLVLLTTVGRRGDAARAHEVGFAAYLTKPIQPTMLLRCLEVVLGEDDDAATGPVTRHTLAAASGARVLLGESHRVYQKLVAGLLHRSGAVVDAVSTGEDAEAAVARHHYDLVLVEATLPGASVETVVGAVRHLDSGARRTPVLAMASRLSEEDRQALLDAGVDAIVSRPLERHELDELLDRWVPAGVGYDTVQLAESDEASPVNVARLTEAAGGSAEFERQLVSLFCEQVSSQIDGLAALLEDEALEPLRRAGQTLRSTCVNFGATRLAEVAAGLEEVRDAGAARLVVGALRDELARTRDFLDRRQRQAAASTGPSDG
jgi:PAS domain S-box-containing protein